MKDRYTRIGNELDRRELATLHSLARERLAELLDEIEDQIGLGKESA